MKCLVRKSLIWFSRAKICSSWNVRRSNSSPKQKGYAGFYWLCWSFRRSFSYGLFAHLIECVPPFKSRTDPSWSISVTSWVLHLLLAYFPLCASASWRERGEMTQVLSSDRHTTHTSGRGPVKAPVLHCFCSLRKQCELSALSSFQVQISACWIARTYWGQWWFWWCLWRLYWFWS